MTSPDLHSDCRPIEFTECQLQLYSTCRRSSVQQDHGEKEGVFDCEPLSTSVEDDDVEPFS